jgi:predicted acetyltransferase
MLALNIEKAKERKIDALLVTCSIDNEASEKIIIRNGGVYEKEVEVDDDLLKRYWITL